MNIRAATEVDIKSIVSVHLEAFPDFFLSKLGAGFLTELYNGFLFDDQGVLLVAVDESQGVVGFAAGAIAPDSFFRNLRRNRWFFFLLHALPALLRHPSLVFIKLYGALFYRGDTPDTLDGGALLSSIGVSPSVRGKSVGKELLVNFESTVFSKKSPFVYLTTDKLNNDHVNTFYRHCGYSVEGEFTQSGGRKMLRYLKQQPV